MDSNYALLLTVVQTKMFSSVEQSIKPACKNAFREKFTLQILLDL